MFFFREKVRGSFAGPVDDLVARLALSPQQLAAAAHPDARLSEAVRACKRSPA